MTSQWRMSKEDSKYFPSVVRGMTVKQELITRIQVVCMIFTVGCRLHLPIYAIGTASTLFHRFYARAAFHDWHPKHIALACLFIASKSDEAARRASDVAKFWMWHPDYPVDRAKADEVSECILYYELVVCEETCFDLQIDLPYYDLFQFTAELNTPVDITYSAYTFINDSFRLPMTLWYEPRQIAAGALYLSYVQMRKDEKFHYDDSTRFGALLIRDVEIIKEVITTLVDVYKLPKQSTEAESNEEHGSNDSYSDSSPHYEQKTDDDHSLSAYDEIEFSTNNDSGGSEDIDEIF